MYTDRQTHTYREAAGQTGDLQAEGQWEGWVLGRPRHLRLSSGQSMHALVCAHRHSHVLIHTHTPKHKHKRALKAWMVVACLMWSTWQWIPGSRAKQRKRTAVLTFRPAEINSSASNPPNWKCVCVCANVQNQAPFCHIYIYTYI